VSVTVSLLDNVNPAISTALRSTGLMGVVENMFNTTGLFNGIFTVLSGVVPTAINMASNMVSGILGSAQTFLQLRTERGPLVAMDNALNSLFTRETVEAVIANGGIDDILSQPPIWVTLADGSIAQRVILSQDASIFLDETGDIFSIVEDGIMSTGSFVWTEDNRLTMEEGVIEGNMETGYTMRADVEGGQTWNIWVGDEEGNEVVNIDPEIPNGNIRINSTFDSVTSGFTFALTNVLLNFANTYMARINSDTVSSITQKINAISAGSLFNDTNKFLYALANGISNSNSLISAPPYIVGLEQSIIDHSSQAIPADNIFPIVLYKGMTANLPLNGFFDAIRWLMESQIRYRGELVVKAQADLIEYFVSHPSKWNNPVVGVGYSGGFMPFVETVASAGCLMYNIKTLVGLGAPTAYLPGIIPDAVLNLISAVAANKLPAATVLLAGLGWGLSVTNIDQLKDAITSKLSQMVQESNMTGATFPYTLGPKTELIVNVWGSDDIFYRELGVVGPRENFLGKTTYNIEIVGADHFDYIGGINPNNSNPIWNNTVASFVTDLIIASENESDLKAFIEFKKAQGFISSPDGRGVYVVTLPGCGV